MMVIVLLSLCDDIIKIVMYDNILCYLMLWECSDDDDGDHNDDDDGDDDDAIKLIMVVLLPTIMME
jgi:hypothetical protein